MGAIAKKRRQQALAREAEERRIRKEYEKSFSSGLFGARGVASGEFRLKTDSNPWLEERRKSYHSIPSLVDTRPNKKVYRKNYQGEMLERERLAQEEIERKKQRIAPAYSKGAYQYITDETDPRELGRKL